MLPAAISRLPWAVSAGMFASRDNVFVLRGGQQTEAHQEQKHENADHGRQDDVGAANEIPSLFPCLPRLCAWGRRVSMVGGVESGYSGP
jgi:hypothetical protein